MPASPPLPASPADPAAAARPLRARALLLGERIDTAGLERGDAISTAPLALQLEEGLLVVFRYGVVVSVGLDALAEDRVLRDITPRVQGPLGEREEEGVEIVAAAARDEGVGPDGVVRLADLAPERLLLVADALAKSTVLASYERQMAGVFDTLEPWAEELARGRRPAARGRMTRLVGEALLVQHRLAERVAVREKPEILWDRPDLERLYARLAVEYELIDRSDALQRKLDLVGETVTVMTDLIDTQRSLRLEFAVVALIVAEIVLSLVQLLKG
ncbi:RMD1 family protein [Caulobacter sp. KR2-114]|uniref:RMD1 family protein n=1 Tax=Caulobacter sp. KR2-114 TaxID=3400912 RepID=UPI003C0D201D